jgi:hypothetical protein
MSTDTTSPPTQPPLPKPPPLRRPIEQQRVNELRRTTDHANTSSWLWTLFDTEPEGKPHVIAAYPNQCSIQTNGPVVILGSLDDKEWFPVMDLDKAGIYPIPIPVRSIRPIAGKQRQTRVVLFISDN